MELHSQKEQYQTGVRTNKSNLKRRRKQHPAHFVFHLFDSPGAMFIGFPPLFTIRYLESPPINATFGKVPNGIYEVRARLTHSLSTVLAER